MFPFSTEGNVNNGIENNSSIHIQTNTEREQVLVSEFYSLEHSVLEYIWKNFPCISEEVSWPLFFLVGRCFVMNSIFFNKGVFSFSFFSYIYLAKSCFNLFFGGVVQFI